MKSPGTIDPIRYPIKWWLYFYDVLSSSTIVYCLRNLIWILDLQRIVLDYNLYNILQAQASEKSKFSSWKYFKTSLKDHKPQTYNFFSRQKYFKTISKVYSYWVNKKLSDLILLNIKFIQWFDFILLIFFKIKKGILFKKIKRFFAMNVYYYYIIFLFSNKKNINFFNLFMLKYWRFSGHVPSFWKPVHWNLQKKTYI